MIVPSGTPVEPSEFRATWVVAPVLVALLQPAGWNDCPYEIVDDPFPGNCAAYIDTDHDGYCDHGQPPPDRRGGATAADAVPQDTASSGRESTPDASLPGPSGEESRDAGRRPDRAGREPGSSPAEAPRPPGSDGEAGPTATGAGETGGPDGAGAATEGGGVSDAASGIEASLAGAPAVATSSAEGPTAAADGGEEASAALAASANVEGSASASQPPSARPPAARRPGGTRQYYFAWIALGTIAVYSASRLLVARGRLKPSTHRRLWNAVLLFGFLGVGTTGLLLVLRVSYGLALPSALEFLFWHVEAGIVFAIVGAIHGWWHWRYYWRIVRPARRGDGSDAGAPRAGEKENR